MNADLLASALSEIGHPSVKDRSSPSWPYEAFEVRYGEIRGYAAETISDAVKTEHLLSEPEQRRVDLAAAYLMVLEQWRRSQNTVKALQKYKAAASE